MCNYSDCNAMYANNNTAQCATDAFCQLLRYQDMCYVANCTDSCADSCVSDSQTNCSVGCCNTTGCLNGTFASMNMTTTMVTVATPPMTQSTRAPTTTAKTTPKNGKQCHRDQCTGEKCYTGFETFQTCSPSEPHCQLQKMSDKLEWKAGCAKNCSAETFCKASTKPPCLLECCNATSESCLWLNGTLNVPSSATRGPRLTAELMAFLLCLLALALLL
ncbi:uncharacterized protein LOC142904745 [Nelusetta ayraudi]|uniref:uncharacterized protein LOC142904745 n=1 Tax=Nelusetta ayraudi TaxID=303726 RepID=UPI003F6EDBFB